MKYLPRPGTRPIRSNSGSDARDHLANERTFLAWIRTALGIVGLGVVVGKFVEAGGLLAELVGLALVAVGTAMVAYATVRFEKITALLDEGRFQAAAWEPILTALIGLVAAFGAAIVILA